jgi:methyl-accepting chemotaxis protein
MGVRCLGARFVPPPFRLAIRRAAFCWEWFMSVLRTSLRNIRIKLAALLLAFGLVPALAILGVYVIAQSDLEELARMSVRDSSVAAMDIIDRNLFERYGDVQAFGLNGYAHDPANWRRPGADNPLVAAMNGYMTNYGLYRVMLLVSAKGDVLAVNSADATGKKLASDALYATSFAGAPWLSKALKGEYLQGRNGFTGTVVMPAAADPMVGKLYGDDGFTIVFAAPLKNAKDEVIGVWANFADFGLVEQIVERVQGDIAKRGMPSAEVTILDKDGVILVDFDPAKLVNGHVKRDPAVIGKLNLATNGVEAAMLAVKGGAGAIDSLHARKQIMQSAGYAHSVGAYDYPGMGWSTLVRAPIGEAYAVTRWVKTVFMGAIAVFALLIVIGGWFIGGAAARPIVHMTTAMRRLADRDWSVQVPSLARGDEIGHMARAVQVFKDSGIDNERLQKEAEAARVRESEHQEQQRRQREEAALAEQRRQQDAAEAQRRAEEERRQAQEQARIEAEARRKDEMKSLADGFEATVRGVVDTVSTSAREMRKSSTAMSASAEHTSHRPPRSSFPRRSRKSPARWANPRAGRTTRPTRRARPAPRSTACRRRRRRSATWSG